MIITLHISYVGLPLYQILFRDHAGEPSKSRILSCLGDTCLLLASSLSIESLSKNQRHCNGSVVTRRDKISREILPVLENGRDG